MTRPVRMLLPLLAGVVLLVGCRRNSESIPDGVRPSLSAVAEHLSKASPDETEPLHLSVEAVPFDNPVTLRCVLTNVSPNPLRIQERSLPCAGWWSLEVRGLTTEGKFLPLRPPLGSIISPVIPPEITVAPGETVLRDLSLDHVYGLAENPRDVDVLLLWSYKRDRHVSTGVALLPRLKQ
jgi:hypothetical protein